MIDKIKKIGVVGMLAVFCFISLFGSLTMAKPAYAGGLMQIVNPGFDVYITNGIKKQLKEPIAEKIKVGVMMAVMRLMTYFVQKVSYDLAVYAASGGKGQGALAQSKGFGDYMKNVGDHAVGGAIDELGKAMGLNLCKPPDLSLELTLRLGLKQKYCDPETGKGGDQGVCTPTCTLSQFTKNWSAVGTSKYWQNQADNFNFALKPSQSDFGYYLESSAKVDNINAKAKASSENQRKEDQGAKGVTNLISGNIKTPGAVMMEQYKKQSPSNQAENAQRNTGAALASGAEQIPQFAASVFLNTFLSTALKNFMDKGMLFGTCVVPSKCDKGDVSANITNAAYDTQNSSGRAQAEAFYSYLLNINYSVIDDFDLLTQFETCDTDNRGLHNCVLDSVLAEAIRRADLGEAVTIGGLVAENKSVGERKIYGPSSSKNDDYKCFKDGFCYYNIKKLRQARILPLGFEIAATLSPNDKPITLNDLLDNFNNEGSPYYHLVDPDWLLKMPKTRCDLYSYGSSLAAADSNLRAEECTDLKSCVATDSKGNCTNYGYCTREGNIWKFDLNACTPQYRTCKTFTESTTNEKTAYLYRSLDTQNCTADSSGCQAYTFSREYGSIGIMPVELSYDNSWTTKGDYLKYFKSSSAESCTEDAAGCSAFLPYNSTGTTPVYIKKAPGYLLDSVSNDYSICNRTFPTPPAWCLLKGDTKPLDCYRQSDGTYPSTKAQLSAFEQELKNIGADVECNKYAKICLPEEENCNAYTPVSYNGLDIPAKFNPAVVDTNNQVTWNDQCDKSCVGYAAYQELDSNYANGHDIEYIIPSTGSSCTNVGCSGFTNMSTTTNGLEKVEYYSYLRPCILPDTQKQKQFVTYEGSQSSGYRLATYQLVEEKTPANTGYNYNGMAGTSGETGPVGSPKYFYRTPADLEKYNNVCNEKVYWGGASGNYSGTSYYWDKDLSSDCRQFNDNEGHIYYRLLSKTIVASNQCTPYRLNSTELYNDSRISETNCTGSVGKWDDANKVCQVCFQNGEYRDGFCYYDGLPAAATNNAGNSSSCTKAEDTCRSFKGNTGNNVEEIFFDKIEANTTLDWQPTAKVSLVNDSVQTNGYSLKFNNDNGSVLSKNLVLETGQTYEFSFWSRGTVGAANVSVTVGGQTIQIINVGVGDAWQQYKSNAFKLPDSSTGETVTTTAVINITTTNQGSLFLDNIRLVKIRDVVNLVKNSLSVPSVCDSNPYDGLPGEALGCSSYNYNSIGNTNEIYLTNFSYLCREEAVGCTKFTDTNNLDSNNPVAFNIWLEAVASSTPASITLSNNVYSCYVPIGQSGCYIDTLNNGTTKINKIAGYTKDKIISPDSENNVKQVIFKSDSIYMPGYSSDPIYLVANSDAICAAANVGCVESTAVTTNPNSYKPTFTTNYLKLNDPEKYSDNLCKAVENGCKTFVDSDGGNYYFKDPKVLGSKVCSYKTNVKYTRSGGDQSDVTGWFWDNVGKCATGTAVTNWGLLENKGSYCLSNSDCSAGYECVNIGGWPCYGESASFSSEDGGYFGLWSYGTSDFDGFAGNCPTEQDGCTKFVDHNDSQTVKVNGVLQNQPKAYYYLADDKYTNRIADPSCDGEISVKKGCILLDKTDDPVKKYNTYDSYQASISNKSELTPPVSSSNNDSNIIIKAVQDRACSEWLYCGSYTLDSKGNRSCNNLKACNKAGSGDSECAPDGDISYSQDTTGRKLVNFSESDYTKIFGMTNGFTTNPKPTSGKMYDMYNYRYRDTSWAGHEFSGYSVYNYNEPSLDPNGGDDLRGYQMLDIINKINSNQTPSTTKTASNITACRVYPSADSPFFRDDIVEDSSELSKASPFGNANIFQLKLDYTKDGYLSSDCSYTKVTYGGGSVSRFYRIGESVADGVCYGGSLSVDDTKNICPNGVSDCCKLENLEGAKCTTAINNGLQCLTKDKKITQANGQKGYCVEKDYRTINNSSNNHACMTWLPISNIRGEEVSNSVLGSMEESNPNPGGSGYDRYMCIYNEPLVKSTIHVNQNGNFSDDHKTYQFLDSNSQFAMPDFKVAVRYKSGGTFNTNGTVANDWEYFPTYYPYSSIDNDNPLTFFKAAMVSKDDNKTYFNNEGNFNIFVPEDISTVGGDNMIFQPIQRCPLGWVYFYDTTNPNSNFNNPLKCIPLDSSTQNKLMHGSETLLKANQIVRVDYPEGGGYWLDVSNGEDQAEAFLPYRYSTKRSDDFLPSTDIRTGTSFDKYYLSNPIIYKSDIKRIDVYYSMSGYIKPGVAFIDVPSFYNDKDYETYYKNGDLQTTTGQDNNGIHYSYMFKKSDDTDIQGYSWLGFIVDSVKDRLNDYKFSTLFDNHFITNNIIKRCGESLTAQGFYDCPCTVDNADTDHPDACYYRPKNGSTIELNSGVGVRAWFNTKDQFIGFEIGAGDDRNGDNVVSFFFVIHLNNGRCAKVAKIWDKDNGGKAYYYNMKLMEYPIDGIYTLGAPMLEGKNPGVRNNNLLYPNYALIKDDVFAFKTDSNDLTVTNTYNNVNLLTIDPFNFGQVTSQHLETISDLNYGEINLTSYNSYYQKEPEPDYEDAYNSGVPLSIYHGKDALDLHEGENEAGANAFNLDLLGKMFSYVYKNYSLDANDNSTYNLIDNSEYKKYAPEDNADQISPMFGAPICFTDSSNSCSNKVADTMVTNTFSMFSYGSIMGATNTYPGKNFVIENSAELHQTYVNKYGDVLLDKNGGKVTMYYYLWADKQHLPIRKVNIDSDNYPSSQVFSTQGSFPMHVPNCYTGKGEDSFFGFSYSYTQNQFAIPYYNKSGISPCVDNSVPPSLTDNYYCNFYSNMFKTNSQRVDGNLKIADIDSKYYYTGAGTTSTYHFVGVEVKDDSAAIRYDVQNNTIQVNKWEATKLGIESGDAVCVFMPRIQAIDNWNWCNIKSSMLPLTSGNAKITSCSNSGVKTCFGISKTDPTTVQGVPECTLNNAQAWTYGGRIIVKPNIPSNNSTGASNAWDYLEDFVGSE